MFTFLLRVKIARFIDNRFYWFCQCMTRWSIQIYFITRFRYRFDENIFLNEFATIQSIFVSSKSSISQKQQKLKIKFEISKFKKISKTKQTVKSTLTFQNIDIFDSTTCNESKFELYSEIANFLQYFQQCRYQYRKSNLLNLLSNCLCDFAFDWFKIQLKFIFLKRFDKIFTKVFSFAKVFSRRILSKSSHFQLNAFDVISKSIENLSNFKFTFVLVICKLCKQNFNFNKKLYEHVRNHEILKFVKNFHFSINAINLICDIEKKSFVTHVLFVSFAKFQNSIFEFATTFKSIILLKRSIFSSFTFESVSKSTKNTSMHHLIVSFFSHMLQISAQKHQYINVRKHSIVNSFFLIDAIKSTCKNEKKSTINDSLFAFALQKFDIFIATSKQIFELILKNTHFSIYTSKTVSKSKENKSIQCFNISSKSSFRTFESKFQKISFKEFLNICSFLLNNTVNSTCEIAKKSTIVLFTKNAKFIAKWFTAFRIQTVRIRVKLEIERTIFQLSTFEFASKSMKKFSIQQIVCARICKRCKQNFNFNNKFHEHIRQHHARKSTKNFDFRIFTQKFTCKIKKKSAIECSFIFFATSRSQIFSTKIISQFLLSKYSNFSIATYKINSKSMKNAIVVCFFIFSFISSFHSIRKHQEFHIQKFYLIVNDLSRMFVEKFKSFDLR